MNRSKLYIHIGTWKTGSSTIQYLLKYNLSELEKEGFAYLTRENHIVTNNLTIRRSRVKDEQFIQFSREKLSSVLDKKRNKNKHFQFIASSESFSGDPFDGFKNANIVAETLSEITKDLNLDVYVIVYLRRQDDFIESLYTQSIHLGASHSFDQFLSTFDSTAFNWEYLLNSYAEFFGKEKIIVRRYHKHFLPEKDSLIRDFGSVIGSKHLTNYSSTNSRNRGLSRDALEITRLTNTYLDKESQYQLRNIFQEVNSKEPFEKYLFFDMPARKEFLDRYSVSNSFVAKNYVNEPSGQLFPAPDVAKEGKMYQGLTNEAIAVIFAKALLEVHQRMRKKEKKIRKEVRQLFFRKRMRDRFVAFLSKFPGLKSQLRKLFGKS